MAGKPAARITDPTACPESGHGQNPIISGSPDVILEGLAAARFNDHTECGALIVGGEAPTVWINGMRAAVVGSEGDHGNVVTSGAGTIIFGNTHIPAPFIPITPMVVRNEFNRSFQFLTSQGPAQKIGYKICSGRTRNVIGYTCEAGKTKVLCTGMAAEQIIIYVASM
jgi:uncharacterized Zn-binding protein involved in type VI secretion